MYREKPTLQCRSFTELLSICIHGRKMRKFCRNEWPVQKIVQGNTSSSTDADTWKFSDVQLFRLRFTLQLGDFCWAGWSGGKRAREPPLTLIIC